MKLYLVLYLATMQVLFFRVSSAKENVCLKLRQYTTRFINPHCWYNHDVDLFTDEVIIAHRYPLEVYKVVTEDGYILTTFRIPSNRNSSQPIFLQHGATLDSNCWTLIGKKSLPFLLADIGYDVFIGNTRGTNFSNKHKKYPPNSKKYWQFSLDEIAKYDVSAQLDFVSGINPNKIIYVGHSMGGTIGVFHGIVKKEQASELLAGYIFLAPVVYLKKYKLVWVVLFRVAPVIKITADVLGVHAFFQQEIVQKVIFKFCTGLSIQYGVCELITFLVFGFSNEQLQPKDLPKWLASWPRGLSVNSMYHYAQIARSGEVKMYDFGKKKNLEMYGQAKPPFYNLSEISLPVHTFYTAKDPLATPESLQPLQEQLGSQDKSIQLVPPKSSGVKFAHLDFLYARDVETYFYDPFFKLLKEKFSS